MFRTAACLAAFAALLVVAQPATALADVKEDCAKTKDLDRRIRACTRLLWSTRWRDRSTRALALRNRSQAYLLQRKYERAASDAGRAIRLSRRDAQSWALRGDAYRLLGNTRRAVRDYDRAIRRDRDNAALYYKRGRAHHANGDLEKAVADYNEAIRRNPKNAEAFRERGHARREQDKFKEALADYDAALKLDPDLPNVSEGRKVVLKATGSQHPFADCLQEADAKKRIRGCTALLVDSSRRGDGLRFFALHNRSYAYVQQADYEKAIVDATEALKIRPNSAFTYANRADAHRRSERYDEAIADYTKAVTLDPTFSDGFAKRGYAWRKKGEIDKAFTDYSRSAEINPRVAEVHASLAAIHEERHDYKEALGAYEAALKLDPNFASAVAGVTRVKAIIEALAAVTPAPEPTPAEEPEQTPQAPAQPPKIDPSAIVPLEGRLALVIGNDSYKNIRPLEAAVNDATAMAETLKKMNFEVVLATDIGYLEMSRTLAELEKRIDPGDTVFFFFSGHGVALGGVNYLLPSDVPAATVGEESLIKDQAFDVPSVVHRIQKRGARTAILILDACRNDPFETAAGTRSLTQSRGLTRVEPAEGVFMMYAAAARQVSYDQLSANDSNPNSVFTRVFLEEITKFGAKIRDVAKITQTRVYNLAQSANKEQRPAIYDEIIGELILRKPR